MGAAGNVAMNNISAIRPNARMSQVRGERRVIFIVGISHKKRPRAAGRGGLVGLNRYYRHVNDVVVGEILTIKQMLPQPETADEQSCACQDAEQEKRFVVTTAGVQA